MSAKILVIEDDPSSLELMTYLLRAHGYRTLSASHGAAGLAMVRSHHPDLVVCDIQLPGLDGYAIAAQLKADAGTRGITLVAATAMAMVGDRERVLAAGFDAYLSKPIDPETFVSCIEPLLPAEERGITLARPPTHPASDTLPAYRSTILVVDDLAVNHELKRSLFEPLGYRVLSAPTAAAGLALARQAMPALIISDVGLPDMSGFELLRQLKSDRNLQHIPVAIITSTYRDEETRDTALSLGAALFLSRPIDSQQLLLEIEACLATARGGTDEQDPRRRR